MKKSTPPQLLFQPTPEQILAEKIKKATEKVAELKYELSWERGSDVTFYLLGLGEKLRLAEEELKLLRSTQEEQKRNEEPNNHPKGPSAP